MIYVSSTYAIVAKKGLKDKCFQASIDKIKELLPQDPDISGMDALIVAPKDIHGIIGNFLANAIKTKHEKITVIYIYQKDEEEKYLPNGNGIMKFKVSKPSPQDIEQLVSESMANEVSAKKDSLISNDRIKPEDVHTEVEKATEEVLVSEVVMEEKLKLTDMDLTLQNATSLASELVSDSQCGILDMSAVESKIMSAISMVFKLCESGDKITDYRNRLVQLLSVQKVEDVVVVDTLLKSALRLYIAPSDVGRTATCLTWCSLLSRRHNCLLIDLTGSNKFADHGVEPISLDKFLSERIEDHFVCVEGVLSSSDNVEKFVGELRLRLNYYPYVNIILDVSQVELIKELSKSALTVHFITNCTPRGIILNRNCIKDFTTENIAKKVVLIDPPIASTDILHDLTVDPSIYKVITIPYLPQIKACSLRRLNPATAREISLVFEEAFK